MNILLVDDEPFILDLLSETLASHGHRVTAVPDTPAATAAVAAGAFDIAILDYILGRVRGIELMRELAARDPGISFVIMTGNGHPELRFESLKAGAADFLSKPVFESELVRCIEGVVAERRTRCA